MKTRLLLFILLVLSSFAMAQDDKAIFSAPGGFYDQSFFLTLDCQNPNHHVRYTLNGSTPTSESNRFVAPLYLDERLYSTSDIHTIQISPDDLVYVPDSVKHAIVIRAAVFDENDLCISNTVTNTYLIRSLGCEGNGMAIVSICADSLDLFDYESGIFVPGVHWDADKPDHSGNYYQQGKSWERTVNVEFYEPDDNSGINQVCGLRTHGNRSRRYPSKGMKIYAREEYGTKRFQHAFFDGASINSFKHLVLKPFASFWPFSGTQDYFCNALALQVGLDAPLCRPVLLYLNGEYWGVYFIQEKTDERYLEDHHGTDVDNCNIIGNWKGNLEHGDKRNFQQMMGWLENAQLANNTDFSKLCGMIDLDNFIDYYVFETFVGNWDWPGNNMRCWQEGDGPWRWLFFDGDATIQQHDFDVFANAAIYSLPTTWNNYPAAKMLFGKLLENNQFKTAFKTRAYELCESLFRYENTFPIFNDIVEKLRPHIEDQRHRFGYPLSMNSWNNGNELIHTFLKSRTDDYLAIMEAFPLFEPDFLLSDIDRFICFPNPTNGIINIRMNEPWPHETDLSIFDITGKNLFHQTNIVTADEVISIDAQLPAGVYVIRIGTCFQRLIIF